MIKLVTCPTCNESYYIPPGHHCQGPKARVSTQPEVLGELQELPPIPKKIETVKKSTRYTRRKKTHWDNATPRQQIFVNELLSGSTLKDAGKAIKLTGDDKRIAIKAASLMQQPKIYLVLQERMQAMYPNLTGQMAQKLKFILDQPIKLKKEDSGISIKEFLDTATYVKNIMGWDAPKKTANLSAKFNFPSDKK